MKTSGRAAALVYERVLLKPMREAADGPRAGR